jgi:hypothetical protein
MHKVLGPLLTHRPLYRTHSLLTLPFRASPPPPVTRSHAPQLSSHPIPMQHTPSTRHSEYEPTPVWARPRTPPYPVFGVEKKGQLVEAVSYDGEGVRNGREYATESKGYSPTVPHVPPALPANSPGQLAMDIQLKINDVKRRLYSRAVLVIQSYYRRRRSLRQIPRHVAAIKV